MQCPRCQHEAPLRASLERVREASADPDADLMGPIVAALDADATVGEITSCLREGLGLPGDPFEFAAPREAAAPGEKAQREIDEHRHKPEPAPADREAAAR